VGEEEERLRAVGERDGLARALFVTAHEDLAVGEALGGEPPGVRRFPILGAMNHEDEARPGLDPRDERAETEARVESAPPAAEPGVVASAHRDNGV
jgi:hypothetical protein